jgi:hypothetical protein
MSGDPLVTIANPVPEATDPDLTRNRWRAVVFDARCRWGDNDRFGIIRSLNGGRRNDTSGKSQKYKQRGEGDSGLHA